jgi:hypothetical protein
MDLKRDLGLKIVMPDKASLVFAVNSLSQLLNYNVLPESLTIDNVLTDPKKFAREYKNTFRVFLEYIRKIRKGEEISNITKKSWLRLIKEDFKKKIVKEEEEIIPGFSTAVQFLRDNIESIPQKYVGPKKGRAYKERLNSNLISNFYNICKKILEREDFATLDSIKISKKGQTLYSITLLKEAFRILLKKISNYNILNKI